MSRPSGAQWSEGAPVGRYVLLGAMARGGMAEVWHAQHRGPAGFTRDVCLKRVLPGASANGAAQLFLEEARLAARLQHPNIVQVLDFDEHDGTPYLVMELLQGETLAALTARTQRAGAPVSVRLAAGIIERCARGLGHAHRQSPPVVHRDFSPHNVFLTRDGLVKVLDFGIARALGAPLTTAVGMVRGRPAYMAPEQAAGHAVPASDVFSLGVVAYELLTGQRLYPAEFEPVAIFNKLLAERSAWPGPAERNPLVPPGLDALVRRMLERDAAARFTDGAQCAEALLAWLREARLELSEQELAAELSLRGPDGAYARPSSPEAKTLVRGKPVSSPGAPAAAALPADARTVVGEAVVVVPRPSAPHGPGPVPSPVVVFPAPVAPGRKPPVDAGDDPFAEPPRTAATEVVPAVALPQKTELLAAAALGTSQSPVLARGAAPVPSPPTPRAPDRTTLLPAVDALPAPRTSAPPPQAQHTTMLPPVEALPPLKPPARSLAPIIVVVGLVIAIGVGLAVLLSGSEAAPKAVIAKDDRPAPTPVEAVAPPEPPRPPPPPTPARVTLVVESAAPRAQVLVDDVLLGPAPAKVEGPEGQVVVLTLEAPGFQPLTRKVRLSKEFPKLELSPERAKAVGQKRPPGPPSPPPNDLQDPYASPF